jgi:hypothetical protein
MDTKRLRLVTAAAVSWLIIAITSSMPAAAHCDMLDEPVVALAKKAA